MLGALSSFYPYKEDTEVTEERIGAKRIKPVSERVSGSITKRIRQRGRFSQRERESLMCQIHGLWELLEDPTNESPWYGKKMLMVRGWALAETNCDVLRYINSPLLPSFATQFLAGPVRPAMRAPPQFD